MYRCTDVPRYSINRLINFYKQATTRLDNSNELLLKCCVLYCCVHCLLSPSGFWSQCTQILQLQMMTNKTPPLGPAVCDLDEGYNKCPSNLLRKHLGKYSLGRPKERWEVDETGSYSCPMSRFRNEDLDILRCDTMSTVNSCRYFEMWRHVDCK